MNRLRVWLLIVLAVLVPVQGAVAAARSCPHEIASPCQEGMAPMDEEAMDADETVDVQHAADRQDDHGDRHAGKCGLCAACCAGAALVSVFPAQVRFLLTSGETFPVAPVPATSFIVDGQERPPRSC